MGDLLGFGRDFTLAFMGYLPLMAGAYIAVLVLRYPDLTIEGSWSLAGIAACLVAHAASPVLGIVVAPFVGAACGLLTAAIFRTTGRAKLLAGLISYYILEAIGFHLLGDRASIYLDHAESAFGIPDYPNAALFVWIGLALVALGVVIVWQRSSWGIRARLVGENPAASLFYRLSIDREFSLGLVLSNALVGLGGGLWGLYYGQASNVQGIGLVLKAFLALLLGDELLQILRITRRSTVAAAAVGTCLFVFLSVVTEALQVRLGAWIEGGWFRPTDKQLIIALVLILLLRARRSKAVTQGKVSEW